MRWRGARGAVGGAEGAKVRASWHAFDRRQPRWHPVGPREGRERGSDEREEVQHSSACSGHSNRPLCGTRTRAHMHMYLDTRPARCRWARVPGRRSDSTGCVESETTCKTITALVWCSDLLPHTLPFKAVCSRVCRGQWVFECPQQQTNLSFSTLSLVESLLPLCLPLALFVSFSLARAP